MKRLFKNCTFILFSVCTIFVMGSCDSNKGKVKELTEQFVVFYNDGDKASVYDIFPSIKTYENLHMEGSLDSGDDIVVEKDDSTGNYIATINEQKQQRLVFAVDSVGSIQMVDAFGVFHLDSISNELALKTGVPMKKLSDVTIAQLMNPESDFINDLKCMNNNTNLWANSGVYSWGRNSNGYYTSMNFTVTNMSSQTISGKDYFIVVSPKQVSTGAIYNSKTIDGVDLAPSEVREFNVAEPSLYRIASDRDLAYSVEVKYRTESILSFLLNYGKFNGNEYNDYMLHPYRSKVKNSGVFGVVNAEKRGVAYAYKDKSDTSTVVDTLYHGKPINLIWESEKWASIYDNDYQLIGYMQSKDIDVSNSIPSLDLAEMNLISPNGKVNVYDDSDNAPADKVVKTVSVGKALLEFQEWGNVILYERQPNGSMKKIGRVNQENIDYDEE